MKNIDFLLNKLRFITNTKTDKELCEILDINYSTLDTWKSNDKIPKKRLLEISQKLSIDLSDLIDISNNSQQIIKKQAGNNAINVFGTQGSQQKENTEKKYFFINEDIEKVLKSIAPIIEGDKTKRDSFVAYLKEWLIKNI